MARKSFSLFFIAICMLLVSPAVQARQIEASQPADPAGFWRPLPAAQWMEPAWVDFTAADATYHYWHYDLYDRAYSIQVVDINQDGWDDVIVGGASYDLRIWLQNPSCHALAEWADIPTDIPPMDIDVADLNGDGKLEIVVIGYDFLFGGGWAQVFLPSANGYTPLPSLYDVGGMPRKVKIDDVTGNSKPDILITSQDVLDVLVQQPDGSFVLKVYNNPVIQPNEISNSVVSGDFNGDGRRDVAVQVVNRPQGVIVYYQNTQGTLNAGISLPRPFPIDDFSPIGDSMVAGDVNGDQRADLIVIASYNTPNAKVALYIQLPQGGFDRAGGYGDLR